MRLFAPPIIRLALAPSALVLTLLVAGGCDTTPETLPMDEPLDQGAAMRADDQMRNSAGGLLEESQGPTDRR